MYRVIARSLAVISASLLVTICLAQEGVAFASPRAELLRNFTIQQQGLNNGALNLTNPQKDEINKIVMAYVNEQIAQEDRISATERKVEQVAQSREVAQKNLIEALGRVMNSEQRNAWAAARRVAIERGMIPVPKSGR